MSSVFEARIDGVELAPIFSSKAQKRWRVAYTTLYSTRVLLSLGKVVLNKKFLRAPSYTVVDVEPDHSPTTIDQSCPNEVVAQAPAFSKAQKKWRLAYTTLFSTRAWLSLGKKFVHVPSYTVVAVEPEHFPSIDQSSLGEHIIEEENTAQFGEVEDVVSALLSHAEPDHSSINGSNLSKLVRVENADQLLQLGGVEGVVTKLKTNVEDGIRGDEKDIASRKSMYGSNSYRKPPAKTFHVVMETITEGFKDPTILIVLVCAAVSLGFGVHKYGLKGCSDGGSILVAVFLYIAVSTLSNYWPKKQFDKLSQASDNIWVDVIRNGRQQQIPIFDVVVGDVVSLRVGDQVPADGLFLDGDSLQVDESSMTGDNDPMKVDHSLNPFLLSGTKVLDGVARMLVTSVGMNTKRGQRVSTTDVNEKTPLQAKIKDYTLFIGKVGMLVASMVLVILLIRYFMGNMHGHDGSRDFTGGKTNIHDVFKAIVGILATPVVIAAAAFPEGLLLAVKVTFAYSTTRMLANQALVRKLSACEAMASITVICTDKRGTLTMNHMKVTKFWLGQDYIEEGASSSIAPSVRELLHQGVGLNETKHPSGSLFELYDKAIHEWGVKDLCINIEELTKSCDILHIEAFNLEKKRSGVLIKKKVDETIHVHHKGAPEAILAMCSQYHDATGNILDISNHAREKLRQVIQCMATNGLQCIAFAHKQMSQEDSDGKSPSKLEDDCLILLGLVGLKDPCRPGARQAVTDCQSAGVNIKMITGDDISIAEAIASECGIIGQNQGITTGEVVDGEEFRNWADDERMEKVNKLCVIAKASPSDKLLLVQCLKKGHVVAVTGDSTRDAEAFRAADVGLYMGIQSTDMAKESSGVVILDNDFVSVTKVLMWGRGIYISIQTFTQFQLTVNIASLVVDSVIAISAGEPPTINIVAAISAGDVPYAVLQILWLKLIMGTLAALALTIEQPNMDVMQKPPVDRSEPFITNIMWRNMMAQAMYQIAILLTIQFQGESIFSVNSKVKDTLIFNTLILFQIFTKFNVRKFERDVVKGIERKKLFWGVIGIIIVLQVIMVELLKRFAHTERLSLGQWGTCFGIVAVSWLIGWLVKYIPVPKKPFHLF